MRILTCLCLTARLFRMTLVTAQVRDVTPGPLTVTGTCIMYHLTNFDASRNVIFHMRYVSTCVGARVVGGRETMNKSYHTLIKYNRYA
jgi:hypothetical protein